jgi:hypothetical protein
MLAKADDQHKQKLDVPTDPKERRKFWIERGNAMLWGHIPDSKGNYLEPRFNLHWVCYGDQDYRIEPRP